MHIHGMEVGGVWEASGATPLSFQALWHCGGIEHGLQVAGVLHTGVDAAGLHVHPAFHERQPMLFCMLPTLQLIGVGYLNRDPE